MNHATRTATGVLRFLWRELVAKPASIRGWTWTITFLVLLLAAFNLLWLLIETKKPFANFLVLGLAAFFLLRWLSARKKAHGKRLPYRRKR